MVSMIGATRFPDDASLAPEDRSALTRDGRQDTAIIEQSPDR